jgi:hypothetical protein
MRKSTPGKSCWHPYGRCFVKPWNSIALKLWRLLAQVARSMPSPCETSGSAALSQRAWLRALERGWQPFMVVEPDPESPERNPAPFRDQGASGSQNLQGSWSPYTLICEYLNWMPSISLDAASSLKRVPMSYGADAKVRERCLLRGDTSYKPLEWTGHHKFPSDTRYSLPATQGQR